MSRTALVAAASLALPGLVAAQTPTPLVLAGDVLPDGSRVVEIGAVHVDFFGDWVVETRTDAAQDASVVLRSAGPWKQLGDEVGVPAGATIASFDSFSTELFGGVSWVASLDGTPGGSADDAAVYFEGSLWLQEGPVQPWPGTNLPAGSHWLSFDDVRSSAAGGGVLVRGHLDDPSLPGDDETFLALGWLCGSVGVLCGVDVLAAEGHQAPGGVGELIESVRLAPESAALSPSASHLVWSCDLLGDEDTDGVVYRRASANGIHKVLAREGSGSPVPGVRWGPLDGAAVDVNSSGQWTLVGRLDHDDPSLDGVLVENGAVLAREGDVLAAVAPATVAGFGRGPALIDDSGRVVWRAALLEAGASSQALFVDDELLVRTGVTQIAGRRLVSLDGGAEAMSLTPDGERLVFRGTLVGGVEGAFALDLNER